ncbi:uncharacterized protein LOC142339834 [Convolutriloba macropyga]|uniref:uncharacterized protein LOC142339834 n=1 Tax=Convolutriloba macropyga TaxID=536237 RepID=UPI003F522AA7
MRILSGCLSVVFLMSGTNPTNLPQPDHSKQGPEEFTYGVLNIMMKDCMGTSKNDGNNSFWKNWKLCLKEAVYEPPINLTLNENVIAREFVGNYCPTVMPISMDSKREAEHCMKKLHKKREMIMTSATAFYPLSFNLVNSMLCISVLIKTR